MRQGTYVLPHNTLRRKEPNYFLFAYSQLIGYINCRPSLRINLREPSIFRHQTSPRFRAIPVNKLIDGVTITPLCVS
jgi:hypothetical protein